MLTGRRHFPAILVVLTHCDWKLDDGPCSVKNFNKDLSIGGKAAVSDSENVLLFKNVCVFVENLTTFGPYGRWCVPTPLSPHCNSHLILFLLAHRWLRARFNPGGSAGGKWDANRAVFCFMMDHPPAAETVLERARELAALWACRFKNTQITPDIKCCVRFCDAWAYES